MNALYWVRVVPGTRCPGYKLSSVRVVLGTNFSNPFMDPSQTTIWAHVVRGSISDPYTWLVWVRPTEMFYVRATNIIVIVHTFTGNPQTIISLNESIERHELDRAVWEMSPLSTGLVGRLFDGEDMLNTATCVKSGYAKAPACVDGVTCPCTNCS